MDLVEFKELMKVLNLSKSKLARLMNEKSSNIIQTLEGKQIVSENASKFVLNLKNTIDLILDEKLKEIKKKPHDSTDVILIIYNNDDDFFFAAPEVAEKFLCHEINTSVIKMFIHVCEKENIEIRVLVFDKKKYKQWLKDKNFCNCSVHRSEWISSKNHYSLKLGQLELMEGMLTDSLKIIRQFKLLSVLPLDSWTVSKKIDMFKNALLHGIVDLANEAIPNYKNKKLLVSAIIARAIIEREILLYNLHNLVKKFLEENLPIENIVLNKNMMGSKGEFAMIDNINIITLRQKQDKFFNDLSMNKIYDDLSNIVHPNYEGVFNIYADLNQTIEALTFTAHDKGNIGLIALTGIYKAVSCASIWNDEIMQLLPQYIEKFECISPLLENVE